MMTYYTGGNVAEIRRQKAQALRDIDREHKAKIRKAIAELRAAAKAKRAEKRAELDRLKAAYKAAVAEARARFDAEVERLMHSAEEKRPELRSSALTEREIVILALRFSLVGRDVSQARHNRQREKMRNRATAAERRQEEDEQIANDKRGIKSGDRMSRYEAFAQLVHDTPELLTELQAERSVIDDAEMACAQARHEADLGNTEAADWAAEHCSGKAKKRPRGSAASRTVPMYGDIVPQEAAKARGKRAKRAPVTPKGQATLGVGRFGTNALIDQDIQQLTI